ncbi:ankyrin repeat domain-containing protein 16 [Quercus suber]|uniref:Ankyrin repeat domain-containing protein 16 n=1 Tax=Quercus suber TaxID=58331 RepID=A0AAW0K6C2_QUESU|nr:ankyrin repeat domain-containing protein 16 [Quercus suber]
MDSQPFVYLLLKNGNSPAYVRNKEGLSALHIAAKEDNYVVMYILMTACPNMYELLDNKGWNALHAAAESGRLEAFEFLKARLEFDEWSLTYEARLEFRSLINKQDEEGNMPMYLAAINGH